MLVKCNTGSLTSCCLSVVLDFLCFPWTLLNDNAFKWCQYCRFQDKSTAQKNPSKFHTFRVFIFIYLEETGVSDLPLTAPCALNHDEIIPGF